MLAAHRNTGKNSAHVIEQGLEMLLSVSRNMLSSCSTEDTVPTMFPFLQTYTGNRYRALLLHLSSISNSLISPKLHTYAVCNAIIYRCGNIDVALSYNSDDDDVKGATLQEIFSI